MAAHKLYKQAYFDRIENRVTSYTVTKYDVFCIRCLKTWKDDLDEQPCQQVEIKELTRV